MTYNRTIVELKLCISNPELCFAITYNRTIVELKPLSTVILTPLFSILQSYHSGIETFYIVLDGNENISLQSYHSGIETPDDNPAELLFQAYNRTIVELKLVPTDHMVKTGRLTIVP